MVTSFFYIVKYNTEKKFVNMEETKMYDIVLDKISTFTKEDWKNLIYFLGLELNAAKRYEVFISFLKNPEINKILEGIKRNEEEHIEKALMLIERFASKEAPNGMKTLLAIMQINLEFEERAIKVYEGFASSSSDPVLKQLYLDLVSAERGHMHIFRRYIDDIKQQTLDNIFYCPVCGWSINFGKLPNAKDTMCCARCGTHVELFEKDGNFYIKLKNKN